MNEDKTVVHKDMLYSLVQTTATDYRKPFLEILKTRLGAEFLLLAGKDNFDNTSITRVDLGVNQKEITNFYLFRRRFSFQFGVFRKAIFADRVVLELNPRILSNWPIILCRKILSRKTAVWGHAWSRRGRGKGGTIARDFMCLLAGNVIAYTDRDAADFRSRLPQQVPIYCAPNALYLVSDIYDRASETSPFRFTFIGRLVQGKKPELALRAFSMAKSQMPGCRLTIIGDGPLLNSMKHLATELGVLNETEFLGHVSEMSSLAKMIGESVATLSPGYVGLSAIQSFSFGTPILVAENEPHSPEIASVREGKNAVFFKSDDVGDFSRALVETWNNRDAWLSRRPDISQFCSENYSIEAMANGFLKFMES